MNKYSIEELLIGSDYRSQKNYTHIGVIVTAEPRPSVSDNAWLVSYRSPNHLNLQYATIEVYN